MTNIQLQSSNVLYQKQIFFNTINITSSEILRDNFVKQSWCLGGVVWPCLSYPQACVTLVVFAQILFLKLSQPIHHNCWTGTRHVDYNWFSSFERVIHVGAYMVPKEFNYRGSNETIQDWLGLLLFCRGRTVSLSLSCLQGLFCPAL